jgi:hypothetical protein
MPTDDAKPAAVPAGTLWGPSPPSRSKTMHSCLRALFGLAAVLGLCACDDEVVGQWQASTGYCSDQQRDQFTIESDLTGTGTIVMKCTAAAGPALLCTAAMTAIEQASKNRWEIEADMGYCEAMAEEVGRHYKECQVRADGDELRCCNPDGVNCLTYVRAD